MKLYLVSYLKVDDCEHVYEDEHYHFLNESDARSKFKELVKSSLKEIISGDLWEDCNESGYKSMKSILKDLDVDLEKDKYFGWDEGCGYNDLSIEIKEIEIN